MEDDRFDQLARSLVASPSRRTVLGLALGGTLGSALGPLNAVAKKRKKKKTCKGKRKCGGTCIPKTSCCTAADCITGQICVEGQCVTGQGTCLAGANRCLGPGSCAGGTCGCYRTIDNKTRCGTFTDDQRCGRCIADDQCAAFYPEIPGVFCADNTGALCGCSPGLKGVCIAPCPSLSG